jgi:hypothetical protein
MAADAPTPSDASAAEAVDGGSVDASLPDTVGNCPLTRTLSPSESRAYAPFALGNRWTYRGRTRLLSVASSTVEYQQRLEVTGTKTINGVDALVVTDSNPNGNPFPTEEYWLVSDTGLVNQGTKPDSDVPGTTPAAAPYVEVAFPVEVCSAFQQFRTMSAFETVTATSVMRSLEAVTVTGVTFPNALRVERKVTSELNFPALDGGLPPVRDLYSAVDWYAPGLGRVKRSVLTADREYTLELTGAQAGGVAHGVLPGGNIVLLDVDRSYLADWPAVASDGQSFLVLSSRGAPMGGMAAILLGVDGRVVKSTAILQDGGVTVSPRVAYGEGHYLAAYPAINSTKAVMLSSDGTQQGSPLDIAGTGAVAVAYGRGVFLVASNAANGVTITVVNGQGAVTGEVVPYPGQHSSSPRLAFDGRNFLLAWLNTTSEPPNDQATHVSAGRVNSDGNAIDINVTPVTSAPPLQEDVDVAFDGARYVVSWLHRTNESLTGAGEVRIARVGVDGVLLDPGGRVIAPARTDTGKEHPRIARLGAQTIVAWERINYRSAGQSIWIAGTG